MRYAFGDYTLDPQRRELRCHGQQVKLQPKAFPPSACLICRAHWDHVATKQELFWPTCGPSSIVSDATLSTCVTAPSARQWAIASASVRIETLHGRLAIAG